MNQEKMDEKLRDIEYEINKLYLSKDNVETRMEILIELCEEIVIWCEDNA